jgi:hypothetical protein
VVTFLTAYSSFAPLGDLLGQQEVTPFFFFHETRDESEGRGVCFECFAV